MKVQKIITTCLCTAFVLLLVVTVVLSAVAAMCTPRAVERRLARQGFYAFAAENIRDEISHLESVIGIPTADILATVPNETIVTLLKPYVLAVAEQLLQGGEAPAPITFESEQLYALVCATITAEQYNNNATQMEEDRAAAYADLTAAIGETLTFFPSTLLDTAMGILASEQIVDTLYATIRLLRRLVLPAIVLTLLCGGGLLWYRKNDFGKALQLLAGCWSITGAVLFFAALFTFVGNHLLDKFSLSDGLLRRFVIALFENAATGVVSVSAVCFGVGILLLVSAILYNAVKTPCTQAETVVE